MSNTTFASIADSKRGRQVVSQILETATGGGSTIGGKGKASRDASRGPEDMRNLQRNDGHRRDDGSNESGPGVMTQDVTSDQAVKKVVALAAHRRGRARQIGD